MRGHAGDIAEAINKVVFAEFESELKSKLNNTNCKALVSKSSKPVGKPKKSQNTSSGGGATDKNLPEYDFFKFY
jgi:hypothetical protein